jgi:hypothetical protein
MKMVGARLFEGEIDALSLKTILKRKSILLDGPAPRLAPRDFQTPLRHVIL